MRSSLIASVLLVLSCAGSPPADEPVVGPPQVAWKDMTKEQRGKFMNATVMPKMKELFVAYDAKMYTEMNCATCHGDGAKDKSFTMPSPNLPPLPVTPEGFAELAKEHPEALKFMGEKVKPVMASLLGLPEFNPQNAAAGGFGCYACHTMKAAN